MSTTVYLCPLVSIGIHFYQPVSSCLNLCQVVKILAKCQLLCPSVSEIQLLRAAYAAKNCPRGQKIIFFAFYSIIGHFPTENGMGMKKTYSIFSCVSSSKKLNFTHRLPHSLAFYESNCLPMFQNGSLLSLLAPYDSLETLAPGLELHVKFVE